MRLFRNILSRPRENFIAVSTGLSTPFSCALTIFLASVIVVFSASMSALAAEEASKELAFPAEITLDSAPLTIDQAIEKAFELNRTLKSVRKDRDSADSKVAETKAQFGFDLKVDGTFQYVKDSTAFGIPFMSYKPIGFLTPAVDPTNIDPLTGPVAFTNPQLVSGATPSLNVVSTKINNKWQDGAELKLSKPLLTFGKRADAISAARKGREVKGLDVERSRLELVLKVKEAFYGYLLAEEAVNTQQEAVKQAVAHLEAAQTKYNIGTSPKLDVIRAQGEMEQAREALMQAQKNFDLAGMVLANEIGLSVTDRISVSSKDAYVTVGIKPLNYYMDKALENRQELKQVELARELAALNAELSRNKPMVALAGIWTFESKGSAFASQDSWRAILSAQYPLFDNGLARAKVAQAKKEQEKMVLNETDLKEGIRMQVKQAYLNLLEVVQRLDTSSAILKAAEEGYRMADLGFQEGVTAQLDLLDTEHMLTQARLNRAKADHDYEIAKAQLARACAMMEME